MRIALLALHYADYAWQLAQGLSRKGNQVLLILDLSNAANELGDYLKRDTSSFEVEYLPHRPLRSPLIMWNVVHLASRIRHFQPDVIHIQETLQDYLIASVLMARRFAPLVLTIHDHVSHTGSDALLGFRRSRYRYWLRGAAKRVIVHGESIRQELERIDPRLEGKVNVIFHGVIGPVPAEDKHWSPRTVLFFGRIEAYKGLGVFIDAINHLKTKGLAVKAIIAGSGSDLDKHRSRIEGDPTFSLIERYIHRDEIPSLFQEAQVVALPYLDGTQSGVAVMAAAYGRPVVATRVGSIPEMVRHGVTGLITDPGDARAFAEGLAQVLCNDELTRQLGMNAKHAAETMLGWDEIASATIDVYQDCDVQQCGYRV